VVRFPPAAFVTPVFRSAVVERYRSLASPGVVPDQPATLRLTATGMDDDLTRSRHLVAQVRRLWPLGHPDWPAGNPDGQHRPAPGMGRRARLSIPACEHSWRH